MTNASIPREAGLALLVAAALALPALVSPYVLSQASLALTFAMAVLGMNLLLGFSGQICLAQGAFFACGAYATGILNVGFGVDPLLTLPAAAATAALAGVAIGLPALRLPGLQLAVVTFGIASLVPQLLLKLPEITGGVTGLSLDYVDPPAWLPVEPETWLYLLCLSGAAACALVMLRLTSGDAGRTLLALRDDTLIARSVGIDITRTRLAVFAVSSAFAGLGGGLYAVLNAFISPQSFLATRSLDILVGAVIGGVTSVAGGFVGALFIVFVPEWVSEVSPALGALVYGACLVAVMLAANDGVVGLVVRTVSRLSRLAAGRPSWRVGRLKPTMKEGGRT